MGYYRASVLALLRTIKDRKAEKIFCRGYAEGKPRPACSCMAVLLVNAVRSTNLLLSILVPLPPGQQDSWLFLVCLDFCRLSQGYFDPNRIGLCLRHLQESVRTPKKTLDLKAKGP